MNQSNSKLVTLLVALIIALGFGAWALSSYQSDDTTPQSQANADSNQGSNRPETTKPGRIENSYQATPGITSLEQLKSEARDVIIVENSEFGAYVDSIEGHQGGTEGYYWSFYINGEMAQVGADDYIQEEGDIIEWKYQNL